jgi:hypothetical protein
MGIITVSFKKSIGKIKKTFIRKCVILQNNPLFDILKKPAYGGGDGIFAP